MKEPTSEVDKNAVAVVRTNSHCTEEVVCHGQQTRHDCIHFYPYPVILWISLQLKNASTMEVNTDWKSMRILFFMDLKGPINWLKNKTTKIEEKLNETVKIV